MSLPNQFETDLILSTVAASDGISPSLVPYSYYNICCPMAGMECCLPEDEDDDEVEEIMEIPIVKKMSMRFGKPQKKEFVFIED